MRAAKNGHAFTAVVNSSATIGGAWDPYLYRRNGKREELGAYAAIQKAGAAPVLLRTSSFRALEYRDIPPPSYLSFQLESASQEHQQHFPLVPERTLLFGTMRAYLGNAVVTPLADWLHMGAPIFFPVKSEFVVVDPQDNLRFFWLAYMRSAPFLAHLPLGAGGTRPRLQAESLLATPVQVPPLAVRQKIDQELRELAAEEWRGRQRLALALGQLVRAAPAS